MADEDRIREIGRSARHVRKPLPRSIWIVAICVGVACLIFAAMILASSTTATPSSQKAPASNGSFGLGLGVGLGAGFVIGLAVGRRKRD